jgi:hypothetical protein
MDEPLQVLCVVGTFGRNFATHTVISNIAERLAI